MKVHVVFIIGIVLVLVGAGGYILGSAKHDRMTAKALIFLGGGKDVRMFNVLTQIEHEIDAKEDSKALQIIAKHKEQIHSALIACYGQKTCEDEFSGLYPEKWLADMHPNKAPQPTQ